MTPNPNFYRQMAQVTKRLVYCNRVQWVTTKILPRGARRTHIIVSGNLREPGMAIFLESYSALNVRLRSQL